ncbi:MULTISPECIES: chemotaxis protein CheA [unclassified Escherichia]|uniref:chemotaxis protein CheA n=1 Tax=unclassified Escherichia TaxID=2608889 RepID=UPI00102A8475|nr:MULTISPECIES: chemotaxis protein CheA [unclassified Escherichia]RZN44850.1 chemotaxis protein CheA [Escherichia sp. E13S3]TGC00562.1 chemotaxis protein CheA [Escherichia sp. E2661]
MDISDFYQTFFDEADELLADMEGHLLELNPRAPDKESLNAIFRAAHSIKGGAGTFGFTILQETTHILENILDDARSGKLQLNEGIINLFLESKDIMQDQLDAYKSSRTPDEDSYRYICEALRQLALESKEGSVNNSHQAEPIKESKKDTGTGEDVLKITLKDLGEKDFEPLVEELKNLGMLQDLKIEKSSLQARMLTTTAADDILAVLCFILEPEQITIDVCDEDFVENTCLDADGVAKETNDNGFSATNSSPIGAAPSRKLRSASESRKQSTESGSIRVAVEKVDQIINQVGELIITQTMLTQLSAGLDPAQYDSLINSIAQLERNARDLQASVMSIRMMPMEYVFSRFPRLVHDLANKLNKQVELTLWGGSAELDKSLIERIIDPLTHLVRNSLDHGIEPIDVRLANGKPATGSLTLSAEHHGGNIVIEVVDDGAGLNREKILARAHAQGVAISDNPSDEEVWMLIFAAGFSTAEKVTDVSGRGVGMDVVKRNIQDMGGHVTIHSEQGRGTTIRIILPLTLAILDGMSVRVGAEIYVLPLGAVMESLMLLEMPLNRMSGGELVLKVREEYLALIELNRLFGIQSDLQSVNEGIAVVVQSAGIRYALLVDQLIGQHQVVVKNLEQNYRKVPGIAAATILGDGSVAMILDVAALYSRTSMTPAIVDSGKVLN